MLQPPTNETTVFDTQINSEQRVTLLEFLDTNRDEIVTTFHSLMLSYFDELHEDIYPVNFVASELVNYMKNDSFPGLQKFHLYISQSEDLLIQISMQVGIGKAKIGRDMINLEFLIEVDYSQGCYEWKPRLLIIEINTIAHDYEEEEKLNLVRYLKFYINEVLPQNRNIPTINEMVNGVNKKNNRILFLDGTKTYEMQLAFEG